jgi:hypothetical protein
LNFNITAFFTKAQPIYDAPAYHTEAPKYYTTKASEYYTTTYAAPAYYTEAPKYYKTGWFGGFLIFFLSSAFFLFFITKLDYNSNFGTEKFGQG